MQVRRCGECSLCCKPLAIEELSKPAHTWCPKVRMGLGCTIYPDRPPSCQEFECLWKLNLVGEKLFPYRTKVVPRLGASKYGETIYLDEDIEGNAKRHYESYIRQWTAEGFTIIIVSKKHRILIPGNPLKSQLKGE